MRWERSDFGRSLYASTLENWEINWEDSITGGMFFCVSPMLNGKMVNAAGGEIGVAGSVGSAVVPGTGIGQSGAAFIGSTLTHPCVDFPNPSSKWGSINTYSMFSYQDWPGYPQTNVGNILDQDNNTGSPRVFQFRLNTAPKASFLIFNTGGSVFAAESNFMVTDDIRRGWTQVGIVDTVNSTVRVITKPIVGNGSIGGIAFTGTARALDLSTNLTMFNVNGGNEQAFLGNIYISAMWRRTLQIEEALRLCAKPFCFLKPASSSSQKTAALAASRRARGLILP